MIDRLYKDQTLNKNLEMPSSERNHITYIEENMQLLKSNIDLLEAKILAQGYSRAIEEKFFCLLKDFFYKAEEFESKVKSETSKGRMKRAFRSLIKPYLYQSVFIRHGLLKPRGYPGDMEILESMYNNSVPFSGTVGFLFDKYFMRNKYTKGVRYRKDKMKEFLIKFIDKNAQGALSILNLACGGCREIREILKAPISRSCKEKLVNFTLVDRDRETIKFARKNIKELDCKWDFRLCNSDIIEFFKKDSGSSYDLIYSIGLADYLPNTILCSLIRKSFERLKKLGCLIIAYKNTSVFLPTDIDWLCDWKFVIRSRSDIEALASICLGAYKGSYRLTFYSIDKIVFFCRIIRV